MRQKYDIVISMTDKLLLVSCCAPCSIGVIHQLHDAQTDFAVLFYNPNIRPMEEYQRRLEENKRICTALGVPFIELPYDPEVWDKATTGLLDEPERGQRCDVCFRLRLIRAAEYAKENGFSRISSVLGISRYKDFDQVCRAGKEAEKITGIPYDTTNWRKNGGEELRARLAKEAALYHQRYCGCKPR